MQFKAVLFDLDGTLLDTLADLGNSINRVLAARGCPVHPLDAYRYFVGSGARNLVEQALPEAMRDDATVDACLAAFQADYAQNWRADTKPYDGIAGMLDAIVEKGLPIAVLSNKPDRLTKLFVAELLSAWRFEVVFGQRDSVPRKPDPAAALDIAERLGVAPGEVLYLGDSGIDMQTATRAGMFAVGVLWGFREANELLADGARLLAAKPMDTLGLLTS